MIDFEGIQRQKFSWLTTTNESMQAAVDLNTFRDKEAGAFWQLNYEHTASPIMAKLAFYVPEEVRNTNKEQFTINVLCNKVITFFHDNEPVPGKFRCKHIEYIHYAGDELPTLYLCFRPSHVS